MSLETRPRTTPDPEQRPHVDEAPDLSVVELLRRLYALFHNKRFGLLLILAMAVLTLIGVLFPQAPSGVTENPDFWKQWVDEMRPRYRGWTDVLAVTGVFGVFGSIGFKAVTVLLACSIVACTTHRLPQLWGRAMRPKVHVRPTFFDHARVNATTVLKADPDAAAALVKAELLRRRFRVLGEADGTPLYADRNRYAPFGTVVAHVAFVVILAGVFVTTTFGFRADDVSVPIGSTVEVGRGTGLAVEARAFTDSYNPDGSPSDYVSDLVLHSNGRPVAEQIVRVNAPLRWDGWSVNQASFGIAADLRATDAAGAVVLEKGIPLSYRTDDQRYVYGKAELPEQKLLVYVITPASGQVVQDIPAGSAQLEVYAEGADKPTFTRVLKPGDPVDGAGLTWTFARERQYTGVMVSRDPGAFIVWLGCSLLAIGTCWTMFLRHHRLWIRLEPTKGGTRVTLASPDRHDVTFDRSVHALVAGLSAPSKKR